MLVNSLLVAVVLILYARGSTSFNKQILINSKLFELQCHISEIISKIISQFRGHGIIFHYDNKSKTCIDSIFLASKLQLGHTICLLANYDVWFQTKYDCIPNRPDGYKFLHFILLTNTSIFDEYTGRSRFSLKHRDIVVFVLNLDSNNLIMITEHSQLGDENMLKRAGGIFVLNGLNLMLYTTCFYCGPITGIVRNIHDYKDSLTIPLLYNYINDFKNFNGHQFLIGYNTYAPLFFGNILESPGNHTADEAEGIESNVLQAVNQKLNMESLLISFREYKNPWASVVRAVSRDVLDWAVGGITLTLKRSEVIDFTARIRAEAYAVMYSLYDDPWMAWENILLPFQVTVWLILAMTAVTISSLMFVTVKTTTFETNVKWQYFIQSCLRLLFEQPISLIYKPIKLRFTSVWLMFLWFMVVLIMTNSYKSRLISSLINSRAEEFDTIEELLEKNYHFHLNDFDATVLQENLRLSGDPKFLETLKRSRNDTNYCESLRKTITHKVAMIDEETKLQDSVQHVCRAQFTLTTLNNLRLISDDLFPSTHAWPVQQNAPFRNAIDDVIHRLRAAGIFTKWANDFASSQSVPKSHHRKMERQAKSLFTLGSIMGLGFIWGLGMLAAILVFIGENVRYKRMIKKKREIERKKMKKEQKKNQNYSRNLYYNKETNYKFVKENDKVVKRNVRNELYLNK